MRKTLLGIFGAALATTSIAQQQVLVHFNPLFEGASIGLNQIVATPGGEDYHLEHHKFYCSRLEIVHDGGQTTRIDTNTVFLVDITSPWLDLGTLPVTNIEGIRFGVGVPEYLNHSDINLYPEVHPLSYQSPSMFWGWSAGYMHMIIGGRFDSNNDGTPETTFELHNLGDDNYFTKEILMPATAHPNDVQILTVNWNLDEWMNGIVPSVVEVSHSSVGVNATIMYNVVDSDVFTSPQNASLGTIDPQTILITYQSGNVVVALPDADLYNFALYSSDGKLVESKVGVTQQFSLESAPTGSYILKLVNSKGEQTTRTVLMP
ncbi:MAG: MbnP family protein [Fluviicola sp.]|jgi:hypothetical protein